jgi:hypothetical protein
VEKSELLKKVLTDYCAQNEELRFQEELLAAFCDYAADWFKQRGVVGVGHTPAGIAIRFADSSEYTLFKTDEETSFATPVFVTGVASKVTRPAGDSAASFPITGR